MSLYPIKFYEIYKQYIWGGAGFEKLNKNPPGGNAAESWEIACHKDGMSVVKNGKYKGKTLQWLVERYGEDLMGTSCSDRADNFPLLVKFINADANLSVQVHPDDDYALKYEGEQGKNEAWVILRADKDAELITGTKDGISYDTFKNALEENNIEQCLNRIKVQPGDVINIPAGLIHAIGKGIMLTEIQQNSNVTYRVYDYNRKDNEGAPRLLHVKKALDAIDFSHIRKCKKALGIKIEIGEKSFRIIAIANSYFCLEIYDVKENIDQKADGKTFLIYVFTDGQGNISYDNNHTKVQKGDTYLLPANFGRFHIEGNLKFIKAYIPDIDKDVVGPMIKAGYGYDEIIYKIDGIMGHK